MKTAVIDFFESADKKSRAESDERAEMMITHLMSELRIDRAAAEAKAQEILQAAPNAVGKYKRKR